MASKKSGGGGANAPVELPVAAHEAASTVDSKTRKYVTETTNNYQNNYFIIRQECPAMIALNPDVLYLVVMTLVAVFYECVYAGQNFGTKLTNS